MRGVILAAGFGTRLWPLTEHRTKPGLPVMNRPLIAYSVEYLARAGIKDIIVNLHHQPDSIREPLGNGSRFGVRIQYSFEKEILGTSGALDPVRDLLADDDFVVINGKIITTVDLADVIRFHRERRALATLVLRPNTAREKFSIVETGSDDHILRFGSAPAVSGGSQLPAPLMFTGIQVLSPTILDLVPRNRFSHSTVDVYPPAIAAGKAVLAYVSDAEWFETSTLERYLAANLTLMRREGKRVIMGAGCSIKAGATVDECVLWERVHVGEGATIEGSVLADDVAIPAGSTIRDAVVVRLDRAGQIERGRIEGENLIVPMLG